MVAQFMEFGGRYSGGRNDLKFDSSKESVAIDTYSRLFFVVSAPSRIVPQISPIPYAPAATRLDPFSFFFCLLVSYGETNQASLFITLLSCESHKHPTTRRHGEGE